MCNGSPELFIQNAYVHTHNVYIGYYIAYASLLFCFSAFILAFLGLVIPTIAIPLFLCENYVAYTPTHLSITYIWKTKIHYSTLNFEVSQCIGSEKGLNCGFLSNVQLNINKKSSPFIPMHGYPDSEIGMKC